MTVFAAAASSSFLPAFIFVLIAAAVRNKREQTLKSFSVDGKFVRETGDVLFAEWRDGRRCRRCSRCAPRKRHEAYSLSAGRFSCRAPSACARVRESACARVRVPAAASRAARLIPMTLKERVVFDLNGSFRHTQKSSSLKRIRRSSLNRRRRRRKTIFPECRGTVPMRDKKRPGERVCARVGGFCSRVRYP